MDVEDFKSGGRAYIQRRDLGRFVDMKPRDDGDWNIWYRDHHSKLQRISVADSEVFAVGSSYQPRPLEEAAECNCEHSHPDSVPTAPCPKHKTHAAEESVPVVYEAREAREIAVESGKTLRWHRVRGGYDAKGRMGIYAIRVRKSDRRKGVLPVTLNVEGGSTVFQFDSINAAKAFAQQSDHVAPYHMRAPAAAMPHALLVPKVATALLPGHGLNPIGEEPRSMPGRPLGKLWTDDAPITVAINRGYLLPTLRTYGPFASHREAMIYVRPLLQPGEKMTFYDRGFAMETRRPKAGEGDAKPVSRWIHWTSVENGKAYVGKGQVTGKSYRVSVFITRPSDRRLRPSWMLLTPVPGVGGVFDNVEQAMLHADKMEANAGGIPHGAEAQEPKDDPAVEAEVCNLAATSNVGMAFIPDVMRSLDRKLSPGAIRGSLRRLNDTGRIELRPEGGLGRVTPADKQLSMMSESGVLITWARPIVGVVEEPHIRKVGAHYELVSKKTGRVLGTHPTYDAALRQERAIQMRQHAAEVPLTKTPLVTLKRNFKKYEACAAATKKLGAIDSPKKVWQLLAKTMLEETGEVFVVVPLNIHDQLSDCPIECFRGARSRVEVDPSVVLQAAISANADSYYCVHQHPGSRSDPSDSDIELTETIEKATKAIDTVEFKDHLVISAGGIYSIRQKKFYRMR